MRCKNFFIFVVLFTLQFLSLVYGQEKSSLYLTENELKNSLIIGEWNYHPGDDMKWANPDFDDSTWEIYNTNIPEDQIQEKKWQGVGWFRKHILVDSSLLDSPLVFLIEQAGSSEIFIDGELVFQTGKKNTGLKKLLGIPQQNSEIFSFKNKIDHVIAIRYINNSTDTFHKAGFGAGFSLKVGLSNEMLEHIEDTLTWNLRNQMFFVALTLAFGLLHLILFYHLP